jgi:hypothetical protein
VNYVIPLKQRQRVLEQMKNSPTGADFSYSARLNQRTREIFIEFRKKYPNRASEVGELIAYLVGLTHLGAVQIASKMALKTNGNMPVHGLDGIHARFSNGIMTLFFLESKLAKSAAAGAVAYAKSIKGFGDNRKQYLLEYHIVTDLSNLDTLPDEEKKVALDYLDVYGSLKSQRLERSVGVLCYSDKILYSEKLPKNDTTPPSAHETALSARLHDTYNSQRELLAKALSKKHVDSTDCKVFLIPFPSINALRETFYKVMNG